LNTAPPLTRVATASLGHKQELNRNFALIEAAGIAFSRHWSLIIHSFDLAFLSFWRPSPARLELVSSAFSRLQVSRLRYAHEDSFLNISTEFSHLANGLGIYARLTLIHPEYQLL